VSQRAVGIGKSIGALFGQRGDNFFFLFSRCEIFVFLFYILLHFADEDDDDDGL